MAYVPANGDNIILVFGGAYTPPAGDNIILSFGGSSGTPVTVYADLAAMVSTARQLQADTGAAVSNQTAGEFDTTVIVQNAALVERNFDTAVRVSSEKVIDVDTLANLQINTPAATPDISIPWGQLPAVDRATGSGWQGRRALNVSIGMGWIKRLAVDGATSASWRQRGAVDQEFKTSWNQCPEKINRTVYSKWLSLKAVDQAKALPWSGLRPVDLNRRTRIVAPRAKDIGKSLAFDKAVIIDLSAFDIPWGNPPPKDRLHRTTWGKQFYEEICWHRYEPPAGDNIILNHNTPITQVGDGDNITLRFSSFTYDRRCSWREPSGWRDAYYYRPPVVVPAGCWATVYTMINTTFLTRLPERTPIDISGLTIATDWDSLYWTIRASVGSDSALALLEPTSEGPVLVEAQVNGHTWNLQVDKWANSDAYGGRSRSITGRSVSAQLGAPAAEIRTYTETEARTAQQLMAAELDDTGWTVAFQGLDDWLVPGNIHSYNDQTPMQVIKSIADTCRAIVQTDMASQTIRILPRYKVPPWSIASATPDIIIPASMVERKDGEWEERPFFNSVHVSGEAGGISARIYRSAMAGDRLAPMETGRLITATEAARALGIAILGASGKWSRYSIELPVFISPAVPGVMLPGSIIEYNLGTSSWRGFVSAVSVSSVRTSEGLKVRQTIDVERYHGE